jgi:hypothetical protein
MAEFNLFIHETKPEVHPLTRHAGKGVQNQHLISALDVNGVGDQHYAPAALLPRKTQHSAYRRLREPRGRSLPVPKIWPPPEFGP